VSTNDSLPQVVFIDSRVPDIQDLLDGLQPGEQAFVIDPTSDGIEQIADVLAANNFTNLASISIVSHGEAGELELGASFITDGNLAGHSNALAEIGAALAPGGNIQLYGCDVAQGTGGQQFINDFSTFAGGVTVDAATHPIGSSGGWTLDAVSASGAPAAGANSPARDAASVPVGMTADRIAPQSNSINVSPSSSDRLPAEAALAPTSPAVAAATVPFTAAALANFQGTLDAAPAPDPELWIASNLLGGDIIHVDDVGGTATNVTTLYAGNGQLTDIAQVVLDPTDQVYFVLHEDAGVGYQILEGSLVQALNTPGAAPTFTTIFTDTQKGTAAGNTNTPADIITQIALDTVNHQIYFTDNFFENTGTNIIDKFEKINYNGTGLTTLATVAHGASTGVVGFALDLVSHNAVFAVNAGGSISFTHVSPPSSFLYEATGVTAAASSVAITQLPIGNAAVHTLNPSLGFFTQDGGLAIDPTTHKLYFTLENGPSGGGLFEYDLTTNPNGNFTTIWHQTAAGPTGAPVNLAIDPTTHEYFIGFEGGTNSVPDQFNGIWSGLLTSTAAPTAFLTSPTFPVNGDEIPEQFSLDQQPTLSITPLNPTFTESTLNPASANNTPVTLISGAAASDPDNSAVVSAKVTIGGFFAGDTLSFSNNHSIVGSYNSSTGVLTFSGVDTFADYQTALQSVQFTSTSDNPTDFGSDNSRVLAWTVNDGLIDSAPQSETVTVVGVNDPPTLSGTANTSFTEKGGAKTLSSAAAASDPDSLTLAGATVAIVAGEFAGDGDVLATTTAGTSITASYNASSETLVLSGSDTLAHYQSVLDKITFNSTSLNPTDFGSDTTRTVTWQVNDGSGSNNLSLVVTSTINVTAVNDPPTLTGANGTVSFTEGQAVTLSPSVTVTDPDSLTIASATVKVAGGTFANDGDVLVTSTVGTAITASYNATSETLTLTGSDTFADYQTVLDKVSFTSGSNPDDFGSSTTRAVTWVLNDGSGSSNLSAPATTTINVTAINDPPVLTNVAPTATYVENAAATTLAAAATVSDVDSLTLANATVKIVGGTFTGDGDVLAASTAGTAITASYNAATETLTLSGSDTLAHYQSVLDHITFSSTSDNPDSFGADPTRTVTWLLNDGAGSNNLSAVTTSTVSVTAVNDAPTLAGTANAAFTENDATPVTLASNVTVSDPDSQTLAGATVKIAGGTFSGDGDLLAVDTSGTAITASYDASAEALILSGTDTLADYQAVLDKVTFTTPSDNPTDFGSAPTRTVTWVLNDGAGSNNTSGALTSTISITALNDAPTLANVAASAGYTEGAAGTVLSSTLTVTDPDNINLVGATVSITGGTFAGDGDVLSFSTAGTAVTASYNAASETLTLSGTDTLAHYQSVLDSVAFSSTSDNPDASGADPTRTITWVVNDGSGASNLSAPATTTVSVTAVNDAPTLAGTTNASFTENGAATTLSANVTVSDPDSQTLASATVKIAAGTFTGDGDLLTAVTAGTSISASYDATAETLTLSGSDTLAHYQSVLDSVTFTTASDNPADFGSDPTRTVTWVLNDGAGSNSQSATQTSTINITAVNDAPTMSGVPAGVTFAVGTTVTLASLAAVADPDNLNLTSATVAITGGTFAGDDDLLAVDPGVLAGIPGISASYDATAETLVLTGTDTLADYQAVLDAVTFSSAAADPTNGGANPTRTLSWTVSDGALASAPQTETLTVQNGPAVNPPAHAAFTEGQASATLAPSLVVTDSNPGASITDATVALTGGTFAGDGDVLAVDAGVLAGIPGIAASYNASAEALVLSGSDTLADYQAVLDTVTFTTASDNPTDFGSDPARTVTWTITDSAAGNNSGSAVSTIDVTAVNDAPVLATVAASAAFTENAGTVTLSSSVSVSDPDNLKLASATVAITGGTFASDGDVLAVDAGVLAGTSITASYNATSETLTLTGSDTLADYQAVLDTLTFNSTSDNPDDFGADPSRQVTWVLNDGSGSSNLSAPATTTVGITALNDAPTISAAATDSFVTGQTLTLSPSLSVSDPDNLNLASATVSVTAGNLAGDVLDAHTAGTGIVASYDATAETLVLSGTDTLAHYQQVLDSVTFSSTAADPTNLGADPTRTITWTANDGALDSAAATTTVSLQVGPALFVPNNAAFTEGDGPTTLSPSLLLNDSNSGAQITSATVKITGGAFVGDGDQLAADAGVLAGIPGISASYDATAETLTLSGADSAAHYQQVLDSITFTTGSDNPDDFGADPTRTVTWTVTDDQSTNNIDTATSTIAITGVNDAPTLNNVAVGASYTENGTAAVLSGTSVTVADPDSLTLASATVSITAGTFAGDGDVLSFNTAGTAITASYNATSEALTLSGSDTTAHYEQVLDSITFSSTSDNPTDFGSDPTRTVTWVVNDGSGSFNVSAAATTTVSVTAVNDAPTVTGQAAHVAFTVANTVTLSPALSVSDPDSLTLAGATVKITGGTFGGDGDVLSIAGATSGTLDAGAIAFSYDASAETLTLTGSDTFADYQTALDSVTFASSLNPNNGGADPTRTITWVVDDGSGASNFSAPVTTTVDIAHTPPTLSGVTDTSFTQGNTTALSPALTVSDFDNATLASATVKITAGSFAGDGDVLSASTAGTSITASYNAATETLTLTGTDTLAHYQSVLDAVKFQSGTDPTSHGADPTRTVTWLVDDGNGSQGLSAAATSTITITPLDAAPTLTTVAATASFTENQSQVTLSGNLSVSDPDSTTMTSATVKIAGGTFAGDGDILAATPAGNITVSYDSATETLTLFGTDTLAHYKQVLDGVTFVTPSDNPADFGADPSRIITWTVADEFNVHSAAATTTLNVTAVNDAPTLADVASTVTYLSGTTLQLSPALTASDVDNINLSSAIVKVTGGTFAGDGDVLHANTAGTHITASYDAVSETLVLSGPDPVATFQAVLDSVSFTTGSNPTNFGADPTRTVTWVVNDGSGSNNLSTTATTTIDISTINTPPALSSIPGTDAFTEGQTLTLAGAALVTDPDNQNVASATVRITGGAFAGDGDVLGFNVGGTAITASYDSVAEILVLSGSDTKAHYQQVLEGLTFASGDNPDDFGANPTRTVTWVLDDGGASNNLSTVQTTTISIAAINDPPTLAGAANVAFTENGPSTALSPSVTVSDPDSLGLVGATVHLAGGFAGDGDQLTFSTAGTAITANYDSTSETLTLTGFDSFADYTQVLNSITFVTPSDNPTNFGSNPNRTVTWTLDDGSASSPTSTVTTTVSITAVNDPPQLSSVVASELLPISHSLVVSPSLVVTDPDNQTLASATVAVTAGTFAGDGDVLAATAVGNITVHYDATSETLTLSGSDTLAHYQQVLDGVTFATGPNPGGAAHNRTITWTVNDGSGSNNVATATTTIDLASPKNDFNGDSVSDVSFQDSSSGLPLIDFLHNSTVATSATLPNPSTTWNIVGSGDFNGDGHADILWQNTGGTPAIWLMNGSSLIGGFALPNPGTSWHEIGTGDFNADGKSDIVLQNTDGTPAIWLMNGTSLTGGFALPNPSPAWHLVGTGDFNADGKSDLVFQNTDGTPAIWLMNGTSLTGGFALPNPSPAWHLVGTGDFNGDGSSDLVFQNTDGTPAVWLMNGTSLTTGVALPNPGSGTQLIGTGDFNGDGKSDLLFQNTATGTPVVWTMNGTTVTAQNTLPNPGSANFHANTG
jgi:hypothetical protein